MKTITCSVLLFVSAIAHAQYYYDDLMDVQELTARMENYIRQKVGTISAAGYDPQGQKTTDFNEWHEVDADSFLLKISTRNGFQVKKQYFYFDNRFHLISITDSSGDIKSITRYTYDANERIVSIKTETDDLLSDFTKTEDHEWIYNSRGVPEKMWKIVNGTDSMEYRFTSDENGNVLDEQFYRRGEGIDPVYYYYNNKNQLTDIVRYNKWARQLLPDYMFEYDDKGNVIQKVTMLSITNPDFLTWRYIYNEKNLKTREALFRREKGATGNAGYILTGRIEYSYTFKS
jgi:YD repeat-containing protein